MASAEITDSSRHFAVTEFIAYLTTTLESKLLSFTGVNTTSYAWAEFHLQQNHYQTLVQYADYHFS